MPPWINLYCKELREILIDIYHPAMRFWALVLVTFAFFFTAAWAHPNLQNSLSVAFEPTRVRVDLSVSIKELAVAHGIEGLPVNGVGRLDTRAIQGAAESHRDYVLKHFKVTSGPSILGGTILGLVSPPFFADPDQTFYQYQIEYPFVGAAAGEIGFFHEMLKEWPYSVGTAWNVSYVVRTKSADGKEGIPWLLPYQKTIWVPTGWQMASAPPAVVATAGNFRSFQEYLWHGVTHILTGYDHLLFIFVLVIGTTKFWQMLKVIAAFTVAHSLTLTLCVFGLVRLPTFIVEPVIALSIIFVAVENVLRPQRAQSNIRLWVAFGFGLIHGLGFAGGLLEAMGGLPSFGIWIALVAFSLGVEVGHQVIVLPLFTLLAVGRKKIELTKYAAMCRLGALGVAGGGVYYLIVAINQQFSW
jgi:HupE / UreJ protein